MKATAMILAIAAVAFVVACGGDDPSDSSPLPRGSEPVELDPAEFTADIDNPYWPMPPGSRWVYRETGENGAERRVVVTVLDRTKTVDGIEARIVHDVVTEGGELVEDTYDWYAQDANGNVWYLGEATKEYDGGKLVGTDGSWEAGVDGAQAGILIPAAPEVGLEYRQEHYEGEAEDRGKILSLDEWVEVPAGSYRPVLMTKDWTPLEPDVLEHKFYAKGVGPVLAVALSGGSGREELLTFRP
jgi:hypothetical protein